MSERTSDGKEAGSRWARSGSIATSETVSRMRGMGSGGLSIVPLEQPAEALARPVQRRSQRQSRVNTNLALEDDYSVQSQYDQGGNRTKVAYPDTDRVLVSKYDRANRMVELSDQPVGQSALITTFGYDSNGNRTTHAAPNGVTTFATFDALNRVKTITATGTADLDGDTAPGDVVYDLSYKYDLAGQRRFATENLSGQATRELAWDYDGLYRLTEETWTGPQAQTRTYSYDPAGNRLSQVVDATASGGSNVTTTYAYDDLNQLLSSNAGSQTTTYTHDINGNRITKSVGGVTTQYIYDVSDRLYQAKVDGDVVLTNAYDARTRRIGKAEPGGPHGVAITSFRYDGGTSFQELRYDEVVTELIRAGGLGGGIGSILYSDSSMRPFTPGPVEFFVYNAVGHTIALTNAAGQLTQTTLYEAFGQTVVQTGTSENNRLRNTKERDASVGLDLDGFRYYDPASGRYVQRDPIGYGDGMNVYRSVQNDPINGIDPLGLEQRTASWKYDETQWANRNEPSVVAPGSAFMQSGTRYTVVDYKFVDGGYWNYTLGHLPFFNGNPTPYHEVTVSYETRPTASDRYFDAAALASYASQKFRDTALHVIDEHQYDTMVGFLAVAAAAIVGGMHQAEGAWDEATSLTGGPSPTPTPYHRSQLPSSMSAQQIAPIHSVNSHLEGKIPLPGTRSTGVSRAKALEVQLVQKTGTGTLDWTRAEIAYIRESGQLPEKIVGHHVNNVSQYPKWAGDPRNIRLVRGQPANLAEHGGNFQTPTTGPLIDRQAMIDNAKSAAQ